MKSEYKGLISLLSCTLIYSFFGILTRTLGFAIPVWYAIFTRAILSAGILLIIARTTHQWQKIAGRDWKWFILRSIAGLIGFYGSYVSFYYIPLGTAYFIFYGGVTLGGYLLGSLMFAERLTKLKLFSLILAILGLACIYSFNPFAGKVLYMLFALMAGFGTAIWNVFSKKISGHYSDTQLNAMDFLLNIFFALIMSVVLHETWVMPAANGIWVTNLLFVIMFLAVGQFMVYGFRHISAQIGSLVMLTEVLFGIIWGATVYHETLSLITVLGGLLILSAIIIPEIHWRKLHL